VPSPAIASVGVVELVAPILVALVFIALASLVREPHRHEFNAIMVAGAGAAYLGAGLGPWEFAYTTVATYIAYRGLHSYTFIGIAWLLHTGWDIVHHLYGNPIVPFVANSSLGCAICDPVIAVWCFIGAPSLVRRGEKETSQTTPSNRPLQPTSGSKV
jgi:hypothetical protein